MGSNPGLHASALSLFKPSCYPSTGGDRDSNSCHRSANTPADYDGNGQRDRDNNAQQHTSDKRSGSAAEAADDRRDEAVDAEGAAYAVGGILRRRDQDSGGGPERRAQGEREHQHRVDRNTEQGRGFTVLRACAQRAPGAGVIEEEREQ